MEAVKIRIGRARDSPTPSTDIVHHRIIIKHSTISIAPSFSSSLLPPSLASPLQPHLQIAVDLSRAQSQSCIWRQAPSPPTTSSTGPQPLQATFLSYPFQTTLPSYRPLVSLSAIDRPDSCDEDTKTHLHRFACAILLVLLISRHNRQHSQEWRLQPLCIRRADRHRILARPLLLQQRHHQPTPHRDSPTTSWPRLSQTLPLQQQRREKGMKIR